jgi:hypothetical protein
MRDQASQPRNLRNYNALVIEQGYFGNPTVLVFRLDNRGRSKIPNKMIFFAFALLAGCTKAPAEAADNVSQPDLTIASEEDWMPGSSSVLEKEMFPKAFLGKWAPSAKDCADQDGVSVMMIYPVGIDFYESGGRLERITQSGQDRTVLTQLAFEGEGGFWNEK